VEALVGRRHIGGGSFCSILGIATEEKEEKEKERIVAFGEGHFFSIKIER
jgi:hypothetical protein